MLRSAFVIALAASAGVAFVTHASALALLLAAAALLLGAATLLDGGPESAKEIAIIATLAAAAAAGRVLLAPVPDVQPVTDIAVLSGITLGLRAGIGVGATAAFVSNFFLGQGLWTPWQMLAWGGCGAVGALLAPLLRGRISLAVTCFLLGYAYGFVLDVWNWYGFYPHTWASFIARQATGFPFNTAHAIGNAALALAAGPELRRMLERYGKRLRTVVVWA
ncbi:MAG: energy-coupling factor transport system substrate-specific component [Gaiellaceae bacterium]|nr:energy-coupling factor transport system substrate-specific component [Gaiellaceae bacterium]